MQRIDKLNTLNMSYNLQANIHDSHILKLVVSQQCKYNILTLIL